MLRTRIVSFPSAITVLSPAVLTVGPPNDCTALLAAGWFAGRDVSARLSRPAVLSLHAPSANGARAAIIPTRRFI